MLQRAGSLSRLVRNFSRESHIFAFSFQDAEEVKREQERQRDRELVASLQGERVEQKKGKVLMDMIDAGRDLESVIHRHRDDIDEELLQMLYSRIEAASR